MSNSREKVQISSAPIPKNAIKDTIFGVEASWINLVQGAVFGFIPILIAILLNKIFVFYNPKTFLAIFGTLTVGMAYLGFAGIDGITLGDYIMNILNFKKNRRRTFYNPRVKTELRSSLINDDGSNSEMLPRKRIMKLVEEINKKVREGDQKVAHENAELYNEEDEEHSFEDDVELDNKTKSANDINDKGGFKLWKKKKSS